MARGTVDGDLFVQHRSEDLDTIRMLVGRYGPSHVVELGTGSGGFTALLAKVVAPAPVYTFDHVTDSMDAAQRETVLARYPNIHATVADLLAAPRDDVRDLVSSGRPLLYCDNGSKQAELVLYGRLLPVGGLLGCHDFGSTEVHQSFTDLVVERWLGYERFGWDELLALPGGSLTRFWMRRTERHAWMRL